jgi:uncharacterized protein involved in exopolysaccharide biosynthesis
VSDQRALALNLLSTLEARQEQLQADIVNLEPAILTLQGELAAAEVREADLTRTRDLADAHYQSLVSKFEEARIAVREAASVIQLASQAPVPTEPVGVGYLGSALVAAVVGSLLGCVSVLFAHSWQRGLERPNPALAAARGASD